MMAVKGNRLLACFIILESTANMTKSYEIHLKVAGNNYSLIIPPHHSNANLGQFGWLRGGGKRML